MSKKNRLKRLKQQPVSDAPGSGRLLGCAPLAEDDARLIRICGQMLKVFEQNAPSDLSPPNALRIALVVLNQIVEAVAERSDAPQPLEHVRRTVLSSLVIGWKIDPMQFAINFPRVKELADKLAAQDKQ